jgi:predicted MFS family arabinose efflux permease
MPIFSPARLTNSASAWPAVASIALGSFVMVTSEFLPIGLLSAIARDLGVTEGRAGLMVTIPGLMAALAAPAATVAARNADRRSLLLILTSLLVAANAIVALAPNFALLLLGRVLLGASVGGFWTFGVAVGRRLVGASGGARATTVILAGISLGTVLGVPVGTAMGAWFGWRASFASVAALALAILAGQMLLLPKLPVSQSIGLAGFAVALRTRAVVVVFVAGALVALGHFSAYTFVEPFLAQVTRLAPGQVSWALAGYGIAGVIGTFAGERLSATDARRGLLWASLAMAFAIIVAAAAGAMPLWAVAGVVAWGAAFGAVPVCLQIWTFKAAPAQFEVVSALMVTVFQVALAGGALAGGLLVDGSGPRAALAFGAACCCACALHILYFGRTPSAVLAAAE